MITVFRTVAGSEAILFARTVSPTLLNVTVFVMLGEAPGATATIRVMSLADDCAGTMLVVVQVTFWPTAEHSQPVPVAETNVNPVGSGSNTVIVPPLLVGAETFETAIVYVAFSPTVKFPVWDRVMPRS